MFDGSVATVDVATTQSFNNLTFNTPGGGYKVVDNSDVLVVNGTLTLTDGQVINGTLNALGNVVLASTFDGGATTLLISGNAVRTFTLPAGAGMPALTVNAPNVTVNTSGSGSIAFPQPVTWQSTAGVTNGAVNWTFNNVVTVNTNVTQGSGDLVYNGTYTQNGGTFTPSAGVLDYSSSFILGGGVFNAPSGVVSFAAGFTISGGTFNAGSGTVVFDGSVATVDVATTQSFNNLTFNTPGGGYKVVDNSDVLVVNGTLTLTDGQVINGTLNALGNVVLASTFDGGGTNITFGGSTDQTFANNGGVNTNGNWTVNKSGGRVTLLTDLNLSSNQPINITSGELNQGPGSNLRAGAITVGVAGVWRDQRQRSHNLRRRCFK